MIIAWITMVVVGGMLLLTVASKLDPLEKILVVIVGLVLVGFLQLMGIPEQAIGHPRTNINDGKYRILAQGHNNGAFLVIVKLTKDARERGPRFYSVPSEVVEIRPRLVKSDEDYQGELEVKTIDGFKRVIFHQPMTSPTVPK